MYPSWRRITRFVPHVLHTITTGASMCLHTVANKLKRGAELEISNQGKRARVHDPNSNDQEPCLESKHKIFLSHSGAQKDFTEELCKDLERVDHFPFFDKRPDSLPKGETFPPLIIEAAKQCHAAILVLSEEFFTRSKWPMIELNEFVEAKASTNPRLKILPLFFGITVNDFNDARRQKRWRKVWQDWATKDDRIDVEKWVLALKVLKSINGMEFDAAVGKMNFREKVVETICKLVPPDLKWDVSHVQAMPKLCEPVMRRMNESEPNHEYGVPVVGVFGLGGIGKTTITRAICNQMFGDFHGKVCHVELGRDNSEELLRKVLRELTEASPEILMKEAGKLGALLKSRMKQHKVFLVLDNLLDDQIEEAKMYLEAGFQSGSRVLVTSRSLDVLNSLKISNCIEMPELDEEEATILFLYHAARNHENFNYDSWKIIQRCVDQCKFLKGDTYHYLPLALQVLGSQLGTVSEDPLTWVESMNNLSTHKFNLFRNPVHPVFSVVRRGYDTLSPRDQFIFMDLALFISRDMMRMGNVLEWLSVVHNMSQDAASHSVRLLKRKGLLEEASKDQCSMEFKMHDLLIEFAQEEARSKLNEYEAFKDRRILYDLNGTDVPPDLEEQPSGRCWAADLQRLAIHKSEVWSLKNTNLRFCSNIKVLVLRNCHNLREINLQGLRSLRSLEVTGCNVLGENFEGVESLQNLVWFRWSNIRKPAPFLRDLSSLTSLQVLHLTGDDSELLFPPNLTKLTKLRVLSLSAHKNLASFPDFGNLTGLERIDFSNCSEASGFLDLSKLSNLQRIDFSHCKKATSLIGLSSLTNVTEINLYGCQLVRDLPGLCGLTALQKLNIAKTGICELPDLRKLWRLQNLSVWKCHNLRSVAGLQYMTSLQRLDASYCENLRELPDFSGMKELEMLDLSGSGVSELPYDLEASNVIGLGSATKLKHLYLGRSGFIVKDLPDLCHLTALQNLDIGGTKISQLPDLRMSWQLQDLIVCSCDKLRSLVVLNHVTSLRRLDASRCRNLRELPDFRDLMELKMVDLSWSGVCALPNEFERLARHRILSVKGCQGLIEPLVVLLKEQQQQSLKRSRGCDSVGSSSSVRTTDQRRSYMSDIAYYLGEVFLPVFRLDDKVTLLPSAHIVGKMKGGVELMIRSLCEHEDMGNLSLVVAAVAGTGDYWPELTARSTIQPLAHHIVQFLKQRIKTLSFSLLQRAPLMLAYLTDNQAMAGALAGHGICTQIQCCLQALEEHNMDSEGTLPRAFEAILERCKATDEVSANDQISGRDVSLPTGGQDSEIYGLSLPVSRYLHQNLVVEDSGNAGDALKVQKAWHEAGFAPALLEIQELGQ